MTTPASGIISIDNLRTELKGTGSLDLNAQDVRRLGGNIVGAVSLNALYNKFCFTINSGAIDIFSGYTSGSYGSLVGNPTTFAGYTIMQCALDTGGNLYFALNGINITPTLFTWMVVGGQKFDYNVNMNYDGNNGIGWTLWHFWGGPTAFGVGFNHNIMLQPTF